MAAFS